MTGASLVESEIDGDPDVGRCVWQRSVDKATIVKGDITWLCLESYAVRQDLAVKFSECVDVDFAQKMRTWDDAKTSVCLCRGVQVDPNIQTTVLNVFV